MTEVQCFLHGRTPKDVLKDKLIYKPGVLRKVMIIASCATTVIQ